MARRRETNEERWARLIAEEDEQARLADRSMWEKINDADSVYDIKEILWELSALLDQTIAHMPR